MSKKWVDVSKVGEIASRGKSYTDSLVGSLSTITQNAISELDETKQEKFDGAPGMLAAFDDTGDPTSIPLWSNENLLRNADFRYPQNQNGMETYVVSSTTEAIPCLKYWWLIGHGSLVVEDGYIRLVPSSSGSYVTMYQDVPLSKPLHIIGNPVTVSMFGTGPMAASFAGYDPSDAWESVLGWSSLIAPANSSLTDSEKLHTRTYYDFDGLNHDYFLRVRFSAMLTNGEARYTAVKLERGSIGTLAYRKATGDWMLNTVMPSYAETPDNLIVTGESGKMAVYDENGELSSFSGNAGDLVTLDQNGNPKSTPVDEIIPSGNVRINKNLIPNWLFLSLVNSRGKTSYPVPNTPIKFAMDGWMIPNGSIYLLRNGNTNFFFSQYIIASKTDAATAQTILETGTLMPPGYNPDPITLSFIVQEIQEGSVRASVVFGNGAKYSTEVADASEWAGSPFNTLLTVTIPTPPKESMKVIIEHKDGTGLRCRPIAIKLEEGTQQTLAYKSSNGRWSIYESTVNETAAWTDANGRVPVGKNLLVNADFEHFYNPAGIPEFYTRCNPIGWAVEGSSLLKFTNGTTIESLTATPASSDLVLISQELLISSDALTSDVLTISGLFGKVNSLNQYPVVRVSYTASGMTSTTADFVPDSTGFFCGTFSGFNGKYAVKVMIVWKHHNVTPECLPKKFKLEFGTVQTLTREVDIEQPPKILQMQPLVINDNLLINANFANFINESGKSKITGNATYTSCWHLKPDATVEYRDGLAALTWTSHSMFLQKVEIPYPYNVPLTLSIVYRTAASDQTGSSQMRLLMIHNNSWSYGPILPNTGGKFMIMTWLITPPNVSGLLLAPITFGIELLTPTNVGTQITREYIRDSMSAYIMAMKLEKGRFSTLARKEYPNANDVDLYGTAFDPVTELARVRSRERYTFPNAYLGVASKQSTVYWGLSLPFIMRVNPVITGFENFRLYGENIAPTAYQITSEGSFAKSLVLTIPNTSDALNATKALYVISSSDPIKFDSNP